MKKEVIHQSVSIAIDDIISTIASDLSHDQIIDIIKQVDKEVANWDFTNKLTKYFKDQEVIFFNEVAEHGIF